jgi:hypothetical protein
MRFVMILFALFMSGPVMAHSWTPTYPHLENSYMSGVLQTTMLLFNGREEVSYYEINVYDKDWNPVKFATTERIIRVDYLQRREIVIYIREEDRDTADYICSRSKMLKGNSTGTSISSRICSRLK